MSDVATTCPPLFWIRASIRDSYPRDQAERMTEPSSMRLAEKERLLRRIAAEIQAAAAKGRTPDIISPFRIEKLDTSCSPGFPQLSLSDPKAAPVSESPIFQSDDPLQIATIAVTHLKKRYLDSVGAIVDHLIARDELRFEDLTAEEAYVFHERRIHIERSRVNLREFAHQQSL